MSQALLCERKIRSNYRDPIEVVWVATAQRCGICVERDGEVFASWDGDRTIRIGVASSLDPDDHLAQMILHELCHALVEGPQRFDLPDWGLEYDHPDHQVREHACLRLQAALADTVGLRKFFAATTDFRSYYDELDEHPLSSVEQEPAIEPARVGWNRAINGPWAEPIRHGLQATKMISDAIEPFTDSVDIWDCHRLQSESE